MLKLLFKSTNDSFSSYSLDTVEIVLSAYIKECGGKLENEKHFSSYAQGLYSNSLRFLAKVAYSSSSQDFKKLKSILEMYHEAETVCFMYSRSSGINSFINCYVMHALNNVDRISFLERKAKDFYFYLNDKYFSASAYGYTNYYIHLFLMMMQYRLFSSVVNTIFSENVFSNNRDFNSNMKKLYGVVICFLYYIVFYEDKKYLEYQYDSSTLKDDVANLLKEKNESIKNVLRNIDLSNEYLSDIQAYLDDYEILIANGPVKTMIMSYAVQEGLVLLKLLSLAPYFNDFDWIYKLVRNDWYSYYVRFVNNKSSENKFLKIAEVLDDSSKINVDNKLNKSYEEGYSKLSEKICSASFLFETENNKWPYSNEDENRFKDEIIKELNNQLLTLQHGDYTSDGKNSFKESLIVDKSAFSGGFSSISTYLKEFIFYNLGVYLSKKLDRFDVYSSIDVELYFKKTKGYDWHFGERYIPYYGDFNIREKIAKRAENIIVSPSFSDGKREHCIIDAFFNSLNIRFDNLNFTLKELSDEDAITEFNFNEENGEVQIVNDVSFHMSKEQFLTYIKNQHRLIDFSYDSYIEAEKSAGLLTVFHRKPID